MLLSKRNQALILILFLITILGLEVHLNKSTSSLFLRSTFWSSKQQKSPIIITAVTVGVRRFVADMLWLDLLQYYGDLSNRKEGYRQYYSKLVMITAMDPHFVYAYINGGAVLVWNLNRIPEGVALMEEGLRENPSANRLALLLAALAFQKTHELKKLIPILEDIVRWPDHPPILERMLGFILEKEHKWQEAYLHWGWVIENTKDLSIKNTAIEHAQNLLVRKIRKNQPLSK